MRVSPDVHLADPWRIHDVVRDFRLEDVWDLPSVRGRSEEFVDFVDMTARFDPFQADSTPTRLLWRLRDRVGHWTGLGRISGTRSGSPESLPIPGTHQQSIAERLPAALRGSAERVRFEHLPFEPLYLTSDEFAAEISNRTVHGVMHLAWVEAADGLWSVRMAVYVKPRGTLGQAYMALIKPFRWWIVYPAIEGQIERAWAGRGGRPYA